MTGKVKGKLGLLELTTAAPAGLPLSALGPWVSVAMTSRCRLRPTEPKGSADDRLSTYTKLLEITGVAEAIDAAKLTNDASRHVAHQYAPVIWSPFRRLSATCLPATC
jgi:hypothetical protein